MDTELLKMALKITENRNWSSICTIEELEGYGTLWVKNILRLADEVKRQGNILSADDD